MPCMQSLEHQFYPISSDIGSGELWTHEHFYSWELCISMMVFLFFIHICISHSHIFRDVQMCRAADTYTNTQYTIHIRGSAMRNEHNNFVVSDSINMPEPLDAHMHKIVVFFPPLSCCIFYILIFALFFFWRVCLYAYGVWYVCWQWLICWLQHCCHQQSHTLLCTHICIISHTPVKVIRAGFETLYGHECEGYELRVCDCWMLS